MESCNILFTLFCLIGCSWFVYKSIEVYFNYGTITNQENVLSTRIKPVNVDICSTLIESINGNILKKYENEAKKYPLDSDQYYSAMYGNLTVQDIFDHSENITIANTIKKCQVRSENSRILKVFNNIECGKHFKIKKYIVSDWICYMIEPTIQEYIPVQNIVSSGAGIVYQIHFNKIFKRNYIKPIIHYENDPPISSSMLASYHKISKSFPFIRFALQYQIFMIQSLGIPYSRFQCGSYNRQYIDCIRNCTYRRILARYGKIIFDHPVELKMENDIIHSYGNAWKIFDQRFIARIDILDGEISKTLDSINEICESKCNIRQCDTNYCLTTFSTVKYDNLAFRVDLPSAPTIKIAVVPRVSLLDTIIYVFSTLGTWFGLVLIDCNPIILYRKLFKIINHSESDVSRRESNSS